MTSGNLTSGNGTSGDPGGRPAKAVRGPDGRPISSLPSVKARVLAFGSILVAGICGALIGNSIVALGCHGSGCTTDEGIGTVVGGVIAAVGVAVVAVLVLRAMGEWRTIKEERALEEAAEAAAAGVHAAVRLEGAATTEGPLDQPPGVRPPDSRPGIRPPDSWPPGSRPGLRPPDSRPPGSPPEGQDASPTE
jgi:hypothetical protein